MLKKFIAILFLLLLFSVAQRGYAQNEELLPHPVESFQRKFNKQQLDSLRQLNEYHYVLPVKAPVTLWDRFKMWLGQMIDRIFFGSKTSIAIQYVLMAILIIFVVYRLLLTDKSGLFNRNSAIKQAAYLYKGNIVEQQFTNEFNAAVGAANFRLAVRYWYLITLQNLHHKSLIKWKEQKTNADYISEIKDDGVKQQFVNLVRMFEYVWYGEQEIDSEAYQVINSGFTNFNNKLGD